MIIPTRSPNHPRAADGIAVAMATAYGIEVLGLRRITLEVFEFNPRGRRVYEKVGYSVTGVRPGALVFDGVAVGAVDMAVDADSWGAR